ncbi:uncharacterized protein DNG_03359 [Cephalotrichum gorgonifer]|uniref:ubiquitinyl hydrolase 1 n=1 Tax=Cephalotrichum gorgonifer TaxID=2041049 RepID=A0AAE8STH7_9PEZI|nr:uncharacterized protein DNG_03359 [Cephalotrichum gorgonifer]
MHHSFAQNISGQAYAMGLLGSELNSIGSKRYSARERGQLSCAGEGDTGFRPNSRSEGGRPYPTLIFETGWSQSIAQLRTKCHWWFSVSKGDVKIVSRPRSSERSYFTLFKTEAAKQTVTNEAEGSNSDKDDRVDNVAARLLELNIHGATPEYIRGMLESKSVAGDVERAVKAINFQQQAAAGNIVRYDAKVKMVGAVNRGAVTCYLDSLLFAMFARFDAFERMLKRDYESGPRQKLATLLRLWVNLLRSGELVHTDTTQLIQETLAECGWADAQLLEQQDTSEAFNFITETLELPLLPLKVDLFHHGKSDESDHKVVHERLLNLAVPPDPDGKGIKLEDCLEEYFNAQVDVLRDSLEDKATTSEPPLSLKPVVSLLDNAAIVESPVSPASPASPISTIRLVPDEDMASGSTTPKPELSRVSVSPRRATVTHTTGEDGTEASPSSPPPRQRSATVIQRVLIDETGRAASDSTISTLHSAQKKRSMVVKAVTIPAWQFFRLMPWHAPNGPTHNSQPQSDRELAVNIRQRPVLGICLKRYGMTTEGMPQRQDTYIDIPDVLRLPNFMIADDEHVEKDPHGFSTGYKLVLQSVVCHRGESLQSGHYVSLARVDPKLLTDNRRCDSDPPPDYEESQWVKFDDLNLDDRVAPVEDLKQGLKDEMPYLLFYQIVPAADSTDAMPAQPPAYNESQTNLAALNTVDPPPLLTSGTPSTATSVNATPPSVSSKPSIRLSSDLDLDRPAQFSVDEATFSSSSRANSRPQSITFPDYFLGETTALHAPGAALSSGPPTPSEETTAQRLSRAAARFSRSSRSRTSSQQGEGRVTLGMKLNLLRTSRELLRDGPSPPSPPSTSTGAPPSADGKDEWAEDKEKDKGKKRKGKGVKGYELDKERGKDKDKDRDRDRDRDKDRECLVM